MNTTTRPARSNPAARDGDAPSTAARSSISAPRHRISASHCAPSYPATDSPNPTTTHRTPNTRAQLITTVNNDIKKVGAPAKPLWDTEVNYGIAGPGGGNPHQTIDGAQAANWVAATYLDNQRLGVDRSYWYFWAPSNPLLGIQMVDGTAGATGFQTVQNWLKDSYASCATGSVPSASRTSPSAAIASA